MTLDYKKLREEFNTIKKEEKKAKYKSHLVDSDRKEEERGKLRAERKQRYWEYLMSEVAQN